MKALDVIRLFDPWNDPLCSCPKKYGFNPYTGCPHACIYCYITSYVPRGFECRPKKDLVERVKRDLEIIGKAPFISMSNSSDPYPPIEKKLELTKKSLEIFVQKKVRLQVITKSDLVVRDAALLKLLPTVVSFTITSLRREITRKLEPGAPPPAKRIAAMKTLGEIGIPVTLRLDPIIPGVNDDEISEVIEAAAEAGAKHVTSSTFKPRPDSWRRFSLAFRDVAEKLSPLYFQAGEKHHNSWYLPRTLRLKLMEKVAESCRKNQMTFACCRESFVNLNTGGSCDGSHLLRS
ncbi:MAG: radical SAM protein [Candidatus Hadarchaeales archaeon]